MLKSTSRQRPVYVPPEAGVFNHGLMSPDWRSGHFSKSGRPAVYLPAATVDAAELVAMIRGEHPAELLTEALEAMVFDLGDTISKRLQEASKEYAQRRIEETQRKAGARERADR